MQAAEERAGAERVLLTLLRSLDTDRFPPIVASLAEGDFVEELQDNGVSVIKLETVGRLRSVGRDVEAVRSVRQAVASTAAAAVQANGEKMSVVAGWAARLAGRPCVFWLHDAPSRDWRGRSVQLAMAATPRDAVVTCSRWMADAFPAWYRLRARSIPNGVELDDLPRSDGSTSAMDAIRAQSGWSQDAVIAVHVARFERWKGTDVFLRAAALAMADEPKLRFVVVGSPMFGRDPEYAASLGPLAEQLGLGSVAHFTGYRTDALELMGSADIAVHASVAAEPFSMVVLETMSLATAVIASRTRGPEEAIEHGTSGLLVEPGNPRALANEIVRLAREPGLRAALGRAAANRVEEHYSASLMARRFEALYEEIMS